jgi:predicted helicase
VTKMKFAGKPGAWDKSKVIYNSHLTLKGIPPQAHEYMLGSRSAIEWVIERYQIRNDTESGIGNDPNDWAVEHEDPEYILDLLKRVVTISVETTRIVKSLPALVVASD